MAAEETSWRAPAFRQNVIAKIDEAFQKIGMPTSKNSVDMENHVFQKAKNKDEYLGFVARLIIRVREMNAKEGGGGMAAGTGGTGGQGMPDPIGALQSMARQGTGNNQMMGMNGPGPGPQGMVPQPQTNTATNLLQSLNQRPGQAMNMQGMQNKMPGMGMMQTQTGGPMGHMGPMQGMQGGPMLTQITQMSQNSMPQQMNQMGPGQLSQMGPGQMGTGQMQQNMQNQIQGQIQKQVPGNQMGGPMAGSMQGALTQQINQMGPGQLGPNQMQQQLGHIQRKPAEMLNAGFAGPRNVTPNQFLRQSPSPSAPSPAGLGAPGSNQMVASPALVSSPSPQHPMMAGPQRSVGMAPSPSSSLNTPGGVGATPSPLQEDQAYRDKVRQLCKYIEPLRRMIARMGNDGNVDKQSKMKKLLEILSNPSKRVPLDTLVKCEIVLEKLDFKRGDGSVGPPVTTVKEHHIFSALLEAVNSHLQSPVANHTLQRTFGPCLEALFGPEIKNLPPPLKKQKIEESVSDIPDILQGEIARLDQRFKVSLDPAQQNGSKCVQLICWLDDRHLPCVPPVSVMVPADYPQTPPRCVMAPHEYATAFLCAVQKALDARIAKLPRRFSVSQLLDTWEMSVRQASAPSQTPVTASTVLMGL
ncbi:mediator of RNA polymerase II transcription subunit 15 [Orussus abietinus]|uniref:mediator of RNA polymerase II transcription subunit 15 n=1 Tax=Orussus abietinus TaxID=222816 RepID=UPI000625AC9C|nr:mediator of RNA polymerase II transcription subunit 15 [Orussus abietinus]XP_012284472.1 mediator of RNA polymerase II transcription subunit 15 [Orussus abietinus]XP_012284478.1 mediator of RNA polymerase II transcription subunit 15 [Orussus abietinus]XP_012284489.1 mediator of RNA polymerase II transcription subunit 15 [Orussus abietinus]XP_012284496.1 mediator of RNA polymerase II transcription subunit 15 [Orussus abietinus]